MTNSLQTQLIQDVYIFNDRKRTPVSNKISTTKSKKMKNHEHVWKVWKNYKNHETFVKNDENFYLIWMGRSWIAQIEGKKYYLLNLPEEERAVEAIARILRYGAPASDDEAAAGVDAGADMGVDADAGGGEEVDVTVDDTTDVEVDA